jgi:hypothetical protein
MVDVHHSRIHGEEFLSAPFYSNAIDPQIVEIVVDRVRIHGQGAAHLGTCQRPNLEHRAGS